MCPVSGVLVLNPTGPRVFEGYVAFHIAVLIYGQGVWGAPLSPVIAHSHFSLQGDPGIQGIKGEKVRKPQCGLALSACWEPF
jgi:hypothetical protein